MPLISNCDKIRDPQSVTLFSAVTFAVTSKLELFLLLDFRVTCDNLLETLRLARSVYKI